VVTKMAETHTCLQNRHMQRQQLQDLQEAIRITMLSKDPHMLLLSLQDRHLQVPLNKCFRSQHQ
jgi:hypothetical protein